MFMSLTNFEVFWFAYPKKVGKRTAIAAFKKHCMDVPMLEIIEAVKEQRRLIQWRHRKYIPHPATWINQHRWEDEYLPEDFGSQKRSHDEFGWELSD
jgi:hypothetical protein